MAEIRCGKGGVLANIASGRLDPTIDINTGVLTRPFPERFAFWRLPSIMNDAGESSDRRSQAFVILRIARGGRSAPASTSCCTALP